MKDKKLDSDLVDEIQYLIELLTKSGFFTDDEILEILDDQFIEEEIDFSQFEIPQNNNSNKNFSKLENTFLKLAKEELGENSSWYAYQSMNKPEISL